MTSITNIYPDVQQEILNKLSMEDQFRLARSTRAFRELVHSQHADMLVAINEPECVFGDLARDVERSFSDITRVFQYFERVRSRRWVDEKLDTKCRAGDADGDSIDIAIKHDNALFFKALIDMGYVAWKAYMNHVPILNSQLHAWFEASHANMYDLKHVSHKLFFSIKNSETETTQSILNGNRIFSVNTQLFDSINTQTTTSPLHIAAWRNEVGLIQQLVGNGARLEAKDYEDHNTPLHIAVLRDNYESVAMLLQLGRGWFNVNIMNAVDETPLVQAIAIGNIRVIQLLLENKADVAIPDYQQRTPLHVAATKDLVEVAEVLIQAGADADARNSDSFTPLLVACEQGNPDMVRYLLITSAASSRQDSRGATCYHYAAAKGHIEVVRILLAANADFEVADEFGVRPLLKAALNNKLDIVEILLDAGAFVNTRDLEGKTPLLAAVSSRNALMTERLLRAGAQIIPDINGYTAVDIAEAQGDDEILALFE